jgi:hypothetical protein
MMTVALTSVLAAAAFGRHPAFAQSFDIPSGQTAGPQTMNGAGDTGTVQPGATIEEVDGDAVRMLNDGQHLANDGGIGAFNCTTGAACGAVNSQGNNAVVVNNGQFLATGLSAAGFIADGSNVYVENNGAIDAFASTAGFGIAGSADNLTVVNKGSVEAEGLFASGILWGGVSGLQVRNSGRIVATGDSVLVIGAFGNNVVIDNSGLVDARGNTSATGIGVLGDGAILTNSGRIFSNQGPALYFGGSGATLNLLGGTAIQGGIVFSGTGNTATFGRGLSAAMTFGGVPATIRTGGRPYVISGSTVAVADITGFASAGAVIEDLTGGIAGAIDARSSNLRAGGGVATTPAGPRAWLAPFGTDRTQDAWGAADGFTNALGGVIAGMETHIEGNILVGAFVGVAGGQTDVDHSAQNITHRSVFAGGYLGHDDGARFADFSFTVGTLDESSRRRVANNTVLGGVEMARADYDGTFVSPSLTLGAHLPYGTGTLSPSLRLRYAGLFFDSYAETGSAGDMAVAARDIHVFNARGQLAFAPAPLATSAGIWQTTWRAGLDGVAQSAGGVSATLLGQDVSFDASDREAALRGFVGANLTLATRNGMVFGGDIEAAYGTDAAFIARAGARLDIAF